MKCVPCRSIITGTRSCSMSDFTLILDTSLRCKDCRLQRAHRAFTVTTSGRAAAVSGWWDPGQPRAGSSRSSCFSAVQSKCWSPARLPQTCPIPCRGAPWCLPTLPGAQHRLRWCWLESSGTRGGLFSVQTLQQRAQVCRSPGGGDSALSSLG